MTRAPLLILSHRAPLAAPLARMVEARRLEAAMDWDVTPERIAAAGGVITTAHLDQIRALDWRDAFARLLDRGGRVVFNGHAARPLLPGLRPFVLSGRALADLALVVLAPHEIFDGVDRATLQTRRGVAGFYGRGHNPMPDGGVALTGVGRARAPLDWVWRRPDGGEIFSHAGLDLWTTADDDAVNARLAETVVAWVRREAPDPTGAA